jgi:hypothetical protein
MPHVAGSLLWRYLRWWAAGLVACVVGFASLWLPLLFESDGAVACVGYGPLPLGLAALWSDLEWMWLDLRQTLRLVEPGPFYAWNLLPSIVVLLGGVVNVWARRRFGGAIAALSALCIAAVALDWSFRSFSYFMMLNCGRWDGRILWLLWRLLPMLCYVTAVGLLIMAIRARRRTSQSAL